MHYVIKSKLGDGYVERIDFDPTDGSFTETYGDRDEAATFESAEAAHDGAQAIRSPGCSWESEFEIRRVGDA